MPFHPVDSKPSFPRLEQDVQAWWNRSGIVLKALDSGDPMRPFVFFEGPPTANGRPGVHHLEARSTKDVVLRYRRMRGHRILGARGGWDAHGLPVEIEAERELGLRRLTSSDSALPSSTAPAKRVLRDISEIGNG